MDTQSTYLLQLIDCNCNDCKYMVRDFDRLEQAKSQHCEWQLNLFNSTKSNLIKKADDWLRRNEIEKNKEKQILNVDKAKQIMKQVEKMKFVFEYDSPIAYGNCSKLNKPVTFIPNVCQIETQECFEHRKSKIEPLI